MTFIVSILMGYLGSTWRKLALYGTGILVILLCLYGLVLYGKSLEGEKQVVRELKVYKSVREKIDETPVSPDISSAVERLRNSGDIRKR